MTRKTTAGSQPDQPPWVYGREGMPVSPGIRRVAAPKRPPLSARQEWFKDRKFGMFIHWGVESIITHRPELAPPALPWSAADFDARSLGTELDRLGRSFAPAAWVDLAERAGQRYICFTTKHHLGFANYASRHSDYNTAMLGPRRDFLRSLANECHRRDMPLFAYLSLPDLHHPDCRPLDAAAWQRFMQHLLSQLEQLATDYGPLAGFWLDPGPWNGASYRYPMAEVEAFVRARWPETLVSSRDWDGAEQTFDRRVFLDDEGQVLDYELFPEGGGPQPEAWPFEVCDTIGGSWFHNPTDANRKDALTLIRRLVEVVGRGGNYLLNQGPLASGAVNPEDARPLEVVGAWLRKHGEAVYDTRPLGTPAQAWGWPVVRGETIYLHVLEWPGERLWLPGIEQPVSAARWLGGKPLRCDAAPEGITIHLPCAPPDEVDSIIVLEQ
ncbi:MAG TPA: alpha-L-fucosidase [Armatimonadota bacterium]|nr:alpha-L-fucosidase [Armatimonadota bacterium]